MIVEPQFPQGFCRFLEVIVERELETDRAKAKLNESSAKELFSLLDSTGCGSIFLEDLYVFLKKRIVNLSKKELRFINKYFGFSKCEKLSLSDFQTYFFQIRDPKNMKMEKGSNQAQALADLVKLVVQGNAEIQEARMIAAKNAEQLRACLSKFYQDESGTITSQLLKEALYSLKLYSRLNFTLLHHYVIGDDLKQITLKQLLLTETSSTEPPVVTSADVKENKKYSMLPSHESKTPGSFKMKTDSSDILLQIENIESAIKQKKDLYTQRKKMLEEESKKPVGMLVKRPSQTDLKSVPKDKPEVAVLTAIDSTKSKFYVKQEKPEEATQPVVFKASQEEPKQKYSFIDTIEEGKDFQAQDIDELLRSRMSSKTREETLNKASSCARLKIQEIERRVMGRVGQRAAATRAQEYISRIPSDLHMKSSELRSRYSSLNRT